MSFLSLIENYVEHRLTELHTALPARIVEYDPIKQEAVVQPLLKKRYFDGDNNPEGLHDYPSIVAVPVIFPSAATGIISFPIKKGDFVLLVFSESSLDRFNFSDGDQPVDPADMRRFDYSDAIAIPGLYPFNKAIGSDPDNLAIRFNANTSNEVSIKMKPNGDCVITTPSKTIVNATNNVEVTTGANALLTVAGNVTANVTGNTTITSPLTTVNGNVVVNGTLSASGLVSAGAGMSITGSTTSTGSISTSGSITASEVTGGGKVLSSHTHSGVQTGGGTSGPPS